MTATVEAQYYRVGTGKIDRQVFADEGCILDVTASGELVGIEILGGRQLNEVLPAIWRVARFPRLVCVQRIPPRLPARVERTDL